MDGSMHSKTPRDDLRNSLNDSDEQRLPLTETPHESAERFQSSSRDHNDGINADNEKSDRISSTNRLTDVSNTNSITKSPRMKGLSDYNIKSIIGSDDLLYKQIAFIRKQNTDLFNGTDFLKKSLLVSESSWAKQAASIRKQNTDLFSGTDFLKKSLLVSENSWAKQAAFITKQSIDLFNGTDFLKKSLLVSESSWAKQAASIRKQNTDLFSGTDFLKKSLLGSDSFLTKQVATIINDHRTASLARNLMGAAALIGQLSNPLDFPVELSSDTELSDSVEPLGIDHSNGVIERYQILHTVDQSLWVDWTQIGSNLPGESSLSEINNVSGIEYSNLLDSMNFIIEFITNQKLTEQPSPIVRWIGGPPSLFDLLTLAAIFKGLRSDEIIYRLLGTPEGVILLLMAIARLYMWLSRPSTS